MLSSFHLGKVDSLNKSRKSVFLENVFHQNISKDKGRETTNDYHFACSFSSKTMSENQEKLRT